MTIGDVLAVVALIGVITASWAATILFFSLAFPGRAARAQQAILARPERCFLRGVGIALVTAILAGILNASHAGPVRIVAGALLVVLGAVAIVGSAGIVGLVRDRIQSSGAAMDPFASLTRGALLYVLAGLLPVFGWFFLLPACLLTSIGGGSIALAREPRLPTPVPSTNGSSPVVNEPVPGSTV